MQDECCNVTTLCDVSSRTDATTIVDQLKAASHPVRWRMLELMAMQDDGMCVCDLETQFALSQPTISHHLRIMREAGIVMTDQRGTWVYYSVAPDAMQRLASAFAQLIPVKA